jgi:elongation factor Tu
MKNRSKSRVGLEIGMWHIEFYTPKRHYAHMHFASQEDFFKAVFTGNFVAEGAVMVVSLQAGLTAETREQLQLARKVGTEALVVFLDGVNGNAVVSAAKTSLLAELQSLGFENVPVIQGDITKALEGDQGQYGAQAIQELLNALDTTVPVPLKNIEMPLLMPVEDTFSIKDRGTVATGRIQEGVVTVGDRVEIVGLQATRTATVTGVEMFRKLLDQGQAGDSVGVVFADLSRDDVQRGQVLAAPGSIQAASEFNAVMYLLSPADGGRHEAILSGYRPQIYIRTMDVTGTVTLPDKKAALTPGEHANVHVQIASPMALRKGLRFAVREGGRSVGAGIITAIQRESTTP